MLKLKLQYFGHLMQRIDSLEKTLMLGGIGGRRRRGQQRMRCLDGITDSMHMSLSELQCFDGQGSLAFCDSWGRKELDETERLNWTDLLFSPGIVLLCCCCLLLLFNLSEVESIDFLAFMLIPDLLHHDQIVLLALFLFWRIYSYTLSHQSLRSFYGSSQVFIITVIRL